MKTICDSLIRYAISDAVIASAVIAIFANAIGKKGKTAHQYGFQITLEDGTMILACDGEKPISLVMEAEIKRDLLQYKIVGSRIASGIDAWKEAYPRLATTVGEYKRIYGARKEPAKPANEPANEPAKPVDVYTGWQNSPPELMDAIPMK